MKTTIIAAILALSPAIGFAMGCSGAKHETAMSCAEGTVYNADSAACEPLTTG